MIIIIISEIIIIKKTYTHRLGRSSLFLQNTTLPKRKKQKQIENSGHALSFFLSPFLPFSHTSIYSQSGEWNFRKKREKKRKEKKNPK